MRFEWIHVYQLHSSHIFEEKRNIAFDKRLLGHIAQLLKSSQKKKNKKKREIHETFDILRSVFLLPLSKLKIRSMCMPVYDIIFSGQKCYH